MEIFCWLFLKPNRKKKKIFVYDLKKFMILKRKWGDKILNEIAKGNADRWSCLVYQNMNFLWIQPMKIMSNMRITFIQYSHKNLHHHHLHFLSQKLQWTLHFISFLCAFFCNTSTIHHMFFYFPFSCIFFFLKQNSFIFPGCMHVFNILNLILQVPFLIFTFNQIHKFGRILDIQQQCMQRVTWFIRTIHWHKSHL